MSACLKHPSFRLAASEDREFCQDRAERDMVNPRSAANRKPYTGGSGGESSPAVGDADSIARRAVAGEKRPEAAPDRRQRSGQGGTYGGVLTLDFLNVARAYARWDVHT